MSAPSLSSPSRLRLRPRSILLARIEVLLRRAALGLERFDPLGTLPHGALSAEPGPVLPLRLIRDDDALLRADR